MKNTFSLFDEPGSEKDADVTAGTSPVGKDQTTGAGSLVGVQSEVARLRDEINNIRAVMAEMGAAVRKVQDDKNRDRDDDQADYRLGPDGRRT